MIKKHASILLCLCLLCGLAAGCAGRVPDFIDLTKMSDTLRSAELANVTANPVKYLGKTIKLGGTYQAEYYEPASRYYHGVYVFDAAACCQSGLEFQWNGQHRYPDDYPENGTAIEVTGVLASYKELGRTNYRLLVDEVVVTG